MHETEIRQSRNLSHSENAMLDKTHKRQQVCGPWARCTIRISCRVHGHSARHRRTREADVGGGVTYQVDEAGGGEPDADEDAGELRQADAVAGAQQAQVLQDVGE